MECEDIVFKRVIIGLPESGNFFLEHGEAFGVGKFIKGNTHGDNCDKVNKN